MRTSILIPLALLPLVLASSLEPRSGATARPAQGEPSVVAASRPFERKADFDGVFVPADAAELSIWPEAYAGELLLLEVVAHGSFVGEGEVVARLETRSLDEEIERAERALRSTRIAHNGAVARAQLDAAASEEGIRTARAGLERSRRSLAGYLEKELEFQSRGRESGLRSYAHMVQDQKDELEQLEAMYREDELFAATEEIVLRRNRRNLHEAELGLKLQEDRNALDRELTTPLSVEARKEQLVLRETAFERKVLTAAIETLAREDGVAKSDSGLADQLQKLERLRRDRELLTLRAPRAGVLLHGGLSDYGPKRPRPDRQRGDRLGTRTALFTVANPDRLALAFEVGESQVGDVRSGMAALVTPVVSASATLVGNLAMTSYPTPQSAAGPENLYAARVEFERLRPGLVVGSRAKAALVLEKRDAAIVLPRTAVFGEGADAHCWIAKAEGGEYVRTPVELGPVDGGEVVIEKGVEAGWRALLSEPGS